MRWLADNGGLDWVVAVTASVLSTPFPEVRRQPITLLMRMYQKAKAIARQKAG